MEEQRGKQIAEGRSDNLAASPAVILPADREDFTPRWLLECVNFFHLSYSDLSFCRVPAQVVGFFCGAININAPPPSRKKWDISGDISSKHVIPRCSSFSVVQTGTESQQRRMSD